VQKCQILIIFAVKICKQCLQTASALVLKAPYRSFAPRCHWDFRPQTSWSMPPPQMTIHGAITAPTNYCWCQKTKSDFPFVWYQYVRSALLGFVTKHACDRETDRITTANTALA